MKRIEIPNDIVAMAIIHMKGNNLNEFVTDFDECEYFQKELYQKFINVGIMSYHYDEFNNDLLEITNNGITLKENRSYIETLMRWLSKLLEEQANILLDEQIMLEILISYKRQKIESEIKKIEIIESKISKPKVMKK